MTDERNMYDCLPCPKCSSRWRFVDAKDDMCHCDDCGFLEPPDAECRDRLGLDKEEQP